MAYQCPRCGQSVRRASSPAVGVAGGAVGAMLMAAFGSFDCPQCGPVQKSEFSPEVQQQMTMGSVGLIAGAFLLLVVAVGVIAWLQTMQ